MLGQSHFKFWSKKVNGQRSTVNCPVGSGQRSGRVGRVRPVKPVQIDQTGLNRLNRSNRSNRSNRFPAATRPAAAHTYNDRFKFLNGGELDFKLAESLTAPPPHAPPSTADKVDTGELGTAQGTRWCGRCRKRSNDQRESPLQQPPNHSTRRGGGFSSYDGAVISYPRFDLVGGRKHSVIIKDIVEAGSTVEALQQRMFMESAFAAPVMGVSVASYPYATRPYFF
ncbi:Subtilase family protein [Hibiscus syriacus]|uniref:Subtilase family protein n=1 Tax=Hibiscus syriacus TaxID=106335 RepID=A0A6A2WJM5_HIBSY|nr:Subtilase family protein [Hibiscus syriacus]